MEPDAKRRADESQFIRGALTPETSFRRENPGVE